MRGLADKVAVVVGGAGGIGTATCVRLAEEGCAVAVGDLDGAAAKGVADRIAATGGRAFGRSTDIGDEDQVRELIGEVVARVTEGSTSFTPTRRTLRAMRSGATPM